MPRMDSKIVLVLQAPNDQLLAIDLSLDPSEISVSEFEMLRDPIIRIADYQIEFDPAKGTEFDRYSESHGTFVATGQELMLAALNPSGILNLQIGETAEPMPAGYQIAFPAWQITTGIGRDKVNLSFQRTPKSE